MCFIIIIYVYMHTTSQYCIMYIWKLKVYKQTRTDFIMYLHECLYYIPNNIIYNPIHNIYVHVYCMNSVKYTVVDINCMKTSQYIKYRDNYYNRYYVHTCIVRRNKRVNVSSYIAVCFNLFKWKSIMLS